MKEETIKLNTILYTRKSHSIGNAIIVSIPKNENFILIQTDYGDYIKCSYKGLKHDFMIGEVASNTHKHYVVIETKI